MRTGLHCNNTRDHARILDYYRRSGANVIKVLTYHNDLLGELKAMGVTIVGRLHADEQPLGGSGARAFLERMMDAAEEHPAVDYWEGYNEAYDGLDQIGRYAEFEIERMRQLEEIGRKAVIGCFSTGTPQVTDGGATWKRFRPALERALAGGHALGLHEYAGPYMQYMTRTPGGKNQWDHQTSQFTGVGVEGIWDPSLDGWLILRYRMAYALFRTWGLGELPLFITEGGIDDTTPRPGPGGKGYKAFANTEWAHIPGIGDYAEQRRWYQWQVTHDTFVRGVTDFGFEGTATGWPDFDLATDPAMLNRIIQLEQTLPAGHGRPPRPGETPEPEPGPEPGPEPEPEPEPAASEVIGPLPMVIVLRGDLLDVARKVYPEITNESDLQRRARLIAAANGLDYDAFADPNQAPILPRYLVIPGHRVSRE